ncbi:MAG: rhodanese-like domain-containing protein [Sulfobacillus thermosulfidooxidans]|nr:MAG: rhodanese-like domain-containing protein [Sulfobacillus thermosulfidooxidans]
MADTISASDLAQLLKNAEPQHPVVVIDVRLGQVGAIPGAYHVPVTDLEDKEWHWDPEADVVVYCQLGKGGSDYAAEVLEEQGYHKVHKLGGGFNAWEAWMQEHPEDIPPKEK